MLENLTNKTTNFDITSFLKALQIAEGRDNDLWRLLTKLLNTDSWVIWHLTDGNFLYVSDKFCEIVKYQREQLVSSSWRRFIHPEDLERTELGASIFDKGEIVPKEYYARWVIGDNTIQWYRWSSILLDVKLEMGISKVERISTLQVPGEFLDE